MIKENKSLKNLFLFLTICVLSGLGLTAMGQETKTQTFTKSTTWTVPDGVTELTLEAIGGGAGGGGVYRKTEKGSAGGGGGAYAKKTIAVTPGTVLTITVGSGGDGLYISSAPGGDSKVSVGSTIYVLAKGGGGVTYNVTDYTLIGHEPSAGYANVAGIGGQASECIGDVVYSGGNGGLGNSNSTREKNNGGGGGGAAGRTGNGANGGNATSSAVGVGGVGNAPGGNGANGASVGNDGKSGSNYGGGGSGAARGTHGSQSGGSGADGVVYVTYVTPPSSINVTFNANMPQNDNNMNAAIPGNTVLAYNTAYGSILDWRDPSYQTARRGYTFTGWNTAADGTGTTITATSVAGTTDITLYAQWTPFTMEVTFDANDGEWTAPDPNPFQVTYGETYSSKTGWDWQVPTKEGYLFQGWKLDGGSMYFGPDSKVNQITDHKLVAEWVAEEKIPSTKTVCYEDVVSLCAPSGYSGYTWTPAAGLSDATAQCPTLTAADMTSASVKYKCNYTSGSVYNGDFNEGNKGFSSDYDIVADASDVNNELQPERKISTTTCWHNVHNTLDSACTLKSYEGDNGLFLAVNGGKYPDEVVWEQTVTVAKNTKYRISVQCAAASPDGDAAPAKLMFFVNGVKASTDTTVVKDHTWKEMFVEWQNTDAVYATIAIKDFTEATGGNDFAIDHVVVEAIDGLGKEFTVDVTRRDQFNPGAIATTGQTRNYGVGTNDPIGSTTAATGGDNSITYQWYKDETEISGATSATYTPEVTAPGTYVFTRKAKDGTCVDLTASTGSWTLTINNVTVSIDTVKGAKAFCAGGSTTLTAEATASQGTISYAWSNGATTAETTVTEAGDYKVTASVTVGGETITDTKTVHVTVYDAPSFTVTPTPESCKGHDGKATVSPEFVSYEWSNGDNSQAPDTLDAGTYTVTVTDANGCQNTKNVTITLNNTLKIEDITGPIVCTGTEFTIFPEDAPEGTTYSWKAPAEIPGISGLADGKDQVCINGTLIADPAIITTPTTVSYTVTPKNGVCAGNDVDVTVTVITTVNPGVTITIPAKMIKCAGTEVEIPAEFVNSVTPHTVKWVLKGTTDTTTHSNLSVNKDTLRIALPETCSAEYTYLVFDADNSGCVANDGCVITVNSGEWNVEPNKTVEVGCAAAAELQPEASELPTITDACGITVTPKYAGATRYPYKLSDGSWTVSTVDHKYKYKACDGTTKDWKYTAVVKDLEPEITCPANITVNTDAGKNYATITLDNPTVDDACGTPTYEITYSPAPPTNATTTNASGQYPMGKTTVTYTVTDNIGQTATCSFTVTVGDDEDPVIVAPADIEVDNYAAVPEPFTTLDEFLAGGGTVSDNVGIDPNTFRYTNKSDGKKCPETFTRIYYIKDVNGNEAFDEQLVKVNDNIAPTFTAPADITLCRALADGSFDANTTITGEPSDLNDNNTAVEDLKVVYTDLDTLPADETDMRVIHREWKVLDECGNATPKIQNIKIYPAITAEKAGFTCPADINETLPFGECEMFINIGKATYGEFFGQELHLTSNAPADGIYPEGTTIVTWTLTDGCGFSISCDQTITVTFPECPKAIDKEGNEYASVRIGCDCWTQRNLESNTYSDGTSIPGVYNYVSPEYPDVDENVNIFGRLYDWESVIKDGADNAYGHVQGICPEGWYLPTAEKYQELNKLGAAALKSSEYWIDGGGNNSTGFTSLPGGYYDGGVDRYMNLMGDAYYWATSKVDDKWTPVPCNIHYICNQIIGADYKSGLGYSVRCIKEKE